MTKYNHYFKTCPYPEIDLYRLGRMFNITDNELFHAFKKIIASGKRGNKSKLQDVIEAIDSLTRYLEIEIEDADLFLADLTDEQPDHCGDQILTARCYVAALRDVIKMSKSDAELQTQATIAENSCANCDESNAKINEKFNTAISTLANAFSSFKSQNFDVSSSSNFAPKIEIAPLKLSPELQPEQFAELLKQSIEDDINAEPEVFHSTAPIFGPAQTTVVTNMRTRLNEGEAQFLHKTCPKCGSSILGDLSDNECCSNTEGGWNSWTLQTETEILNYDDVVVSTYSILNRSYDPNDWGVKLLHTPTNIEVTCEIYVNQERNKTEAFKELTRKVYQHTQEAKGLNNGSTCAE